MNVTLIHATFKVILCLHYVRCLNVILHGF